MRRSWETAGGARYVARRRRREPRLRCLRLGAPRARSRPRSPRRTPPGSDCPRPSRSARPVRARNGRRRARPRRPVGLVGRELPRRGRRPAGTGSVEHGTGIERDDPAQTVEEHRDRRTQPRARRRGLRLRRGRALLGCPPRSEQTKVLMTAATVRKTESARRFSPSRDGERVDRRREVPVDEQEADRPPPSARARRRRPPRSRRRARRKSSSTLGSPSGRAGSQEPGQQRQPDRREQRTRAHAPPWESDRGGRRDVVAPVSVVSATDDVDVEADAGVADHAVDHRSAR